MRFLIVASVLACAAAAPSGLLATSYAIGHSAPIAVAHAAPLAVAHVAPLAVAHAAPLAVAAPTISSGDINGAAIDAHVVASDHTRAAVDAARQQHDQAAEIQGRAINAAESHAWQAVDAVKTQEAQLDGAAAGAAPILAKQLAGHAVVAHAAPVVAHAAPVVAHAAPVIAHAAPVAYAAAPLAASKTVVSQSLHQTHPAPVYHAVHTAPVVAAYGAHGW